MDLKSGMVFALDEELQRLNVDERPEAPTLLINGNNALQAKMKGRRRSSKLERMSVLCPPHNRRLSLSTSEDYKGKSRIKVPADYDGCAISDGDDENDESYQFNTHHQIAGEDIHARSVYDFKPVRVLGQGAYGRVLLVKDQKSKKLFAMKQLKKAEILISQEDETPQNSHNVEKRIERTFAERTILSHLEHPNIVKLFYSFHDNAKLYLILQFIPGGELFYHLKEQGTLDEDTASFYAAEISCALRFLHANGIVYRDLKPENCLLNEMGHLVLTDFGLSKKAVSPSKSSKASDDAHESDREGEDVHTLHSIIGTPEYCAPEILDGQPYNKSCDWYSLGCLIYDMLVGKPPYTGDNHKVILNKIKKDKQGPRIPFYFSSDMKDLLGALLKKDKIKRWDVDKFWKEAPSKHRQHGVKQPKPKKTKERTNAFQSHFCFRKVDWAAIESGHIQRSSPGPIVPVITDWELAENFDAEYTSISYEDDLSPLKSGIEIPNQRRNSRVNDVFNGFSFKANESYLERYFLG